MFKSDKGTEAPPKPPAPPPRQVLPPTEASIVADATLMLAKRLEDLTGRLNARLEPFATPTLVIEPRPQLPALGSVYFNVQYTRLDDMAARVDEIESLLNRLAL